jgi:hypothetical protein
MDTVSNIITIARIALELIKEYIDDPKRRLAAYQKYFDALKLIRQEINNEQDAKAYNDLLLEYIALVHQL